MKELIDLLVEKKRLEDRYGHISCFDAPEQYARMEELADEAREEAKHLASVCDCLPEHILDVAETIAAEIVYGNIREDAYISLVSQDDFIDEYILSGMDDEARKLFDSLFYWMDSDRRAEWLKSQYINHDPNMYTNRPVDFVVMVNEV